MKEPGHRDVHRTIDHLFRQEAGKMVSVLTRIFGFSNIEQAEDIVQDTLVKALEVWKWGKVPDNPQAWLYRAAKNRAIDLIRREKLKYQIENEIAILLRSEYSLTPIVHEMFSEGEIKDSQLRMMFGCCHPALSQEMQITLILKTLCGLNVKEIAGSFLTNEETIQKRLYRTREKIREEKISLDYPGASLMQNRIDAVLKTVYLLFNEGYSSSHHEKPIREELCEEAMQLGILLTENPKTNFPQTNALLALMCYHASRFDSRLDDKGYVILLKDQDRSLWNRFLISKGNEYLSKAAEGETMHDFHIEAGIASIHANADSFEDTDWKNILLMYDDLLRRTDSPVVALNRCLVLGEVEGYGKAIEELEKLKGLSGNFHYNTSLGEMYFRNGNPLEAKKYFTKGLSLTSSAAEVELIGRKMSLC